MLTYILLEQLANQWDSNMDWIIALLIVAVIWYSIKSGKKKGEENIAYQGFD